MLEILKTAVYQMFLAKRKEKGKKIKKNYIIWKKIYTTKIKKVVIYLKESPEEVNMNSCFRIF